MSILFEDTLEVKQIDPHGKKFDKVSRIHGNGIIYEAEIEIDINTELYPIKEEASTLARDGTPDNGLYDPLRDEGLMADYAYVMHGKVFKFSEDKGSALKVYVSEIFTLRSVFLSFGGLLLMIRGEPDQLSQLKLDSRVYLLMRRED